LYQRACNTRTQAGDEAGMVNETILRNLYYEIAIFVTREQSERSEGRTQTTRGNCSFANELQTLFFYIHDSFYFAHARVFAP